MTAKEKAKVLVDKFRPMVNPYVGSGMLSNTYDDDAILWQSKRCALIAVDEIIKAIDITTGHCTFRYLDRVEVQKDLDYWNDVKSEIEKL